MPSLGRILSIPSCRCFARASPPQLATCQPWQGPNELLGD